MSRSCGKGLLLDELLLEDPSSGTLASERLFDAHCHLSFAPQSQSFARWVAENFSGAFSTTVSLADYHFAKQAFSSWPSIRIGLGAHPWWITQGRISAADEEQFAQAVSEARFIGEVGLDFGKRGLAGSVFATEEETKARQVEVLRTVFGAGAVSESIGRVFSFHAVRSADVILDMLQEYNLLPGNTAIFHWFSGSGGELQRAREAGCYFSVNAFMLATKRGCEYARAIPADRLLVETDLPDESDIDRNGEEVRAQYRTALVSTYEQLISMRGATILNALQKNVQRIFSVV